jgi:hypothetical protein
MDTEWLNTRSIAGDGSARAARAIESTMASTALKGSVSQP